MPFPDSKKSKTAPSSTSQSEEDELLNAFGETEEIAETSPKVAEKATLPPVRRSKLAVSASIEKREIQKALAPREEMISTAKELLKRAGTSIEELAKTNNNVEKGFSIQKKGLNTTDQAPLAPSKEKSNPTKKETPANTTDPFADTEIFSAPLDSVDPSEPLDSTTDLPDFRKKKSIQTKKTGFFHYLGIASLIGIFAGLSYLIYLFINGLISAPIPTVDEVAVISQEEVLEAEQVKKLVPISEDSPVINEARRIANDYFSAESKRFAYSYVAPNPNVNSAFNKYWEAEKDYTPELLLFYEGFTLPDDSQWVLFNYGTDTQRKKVIMTKKSGENFKLDWQALSEIETISLGDLIAEASTDPCVIRAWIQEDSEYPVKYPDSFWQSFSLHNVKDDSINCYLAKNTSTLKKLSDELIRNYTSHPTGGQKGLYVKLLVHKPEIGAEYVEILDLISTSWSQEVDDLRGSLNASE